MHMHLIFTTMGSTDATTTTNIAATDAAGGGEAADAAAAAPQDVPMPEAQNHVDDDPVEGTTATAAAAAATASSKGPGPGDAAKCVKCMKRYGKSTCSQLACIKCCTDIDGCEGHRALREEKRRQDEILAGTSAVNVRAAKQRKMAVTPGAFPGEPAFRYLQESLVVWDCRRYLDNPKWREDAIRRSERNKRAREVFVAAAAGGTGSTKKEGGEETTGPKKKSRKEGRKRRFQRIMNEMYEASIKA